MIFFDKTTITADNRVGRMTGAFKWPSLLRHFLEILTKPVDTRATTAARAGCVRRGLGRYKNALPKMT